MSRGRANPWTLASVAVALVSLVPFAYGLAAGGSFYFRDISGYFFPLRGYVVEGLRSGEIRLWNPYVNEGVPVPAALAYPIDLLQVLLPNVWGFSLLLALHVPLAALMFLVLARRLGWEPAPAALGALAYALGGFSLSAVNLYIHIEAFAWAPLVVALLLAASTGGAREMAAAAAALALCLSTLGVEIALQAVACGWILAASRRLDVYARLAGSTLLGIGLAGAPLLVLSNMVSGSQREGGFAIPVALDHSVHPVSLLQTVIAGLYGDTMSFGNAYWGHRFWHGGYPYFISLYVGGAVVCLVVIGALGRERWRAPLLVLLAVGLVVALGSWARLDLLLELVPALRRFRFPVKAFFTVTLAASLLAAAAAQRLVHTPRLWRALLVLAAALGVALLSLRFVETLLPAGFDWLQAHFFHAPYPRALRAPVLRAVGADAAMGGLALLAVAGLCVLKLRDRLSGQAAVIALAGIVAADLLRAGAGLNPTAHRDLYTFSPEMAAEAARLREAGGRAFTCAVQAFPAYREAFERRGSRTGVWTYAVMREALTPYANVEVRVPTVGRDPTDLVPVERGLSADEETCQARGTLEKLRAMGVRHLLAVDPILSDGLRVVREIAPARTAPVSIYVHEVQNALPDPTIAPAPDDVDAHGVAQGVGGASARYVETRSTSVRLLVESPREAYVIVRRAFAPGWSATVNGRAAALVPANGRHQAVPVPAGRSEVELRYRVPKGGRGVALSLASAVVAALLWFRGSAARRLDERAV